MSINSLIRKACTVSFILASKISQLVIQPAGKWNPIYLFYEMVHKNLGGKIGNKGNRHYKCYHSNWKVITVTCAMKYSLNGKPSNFLLLQANLDTLKCRLNWSPEGPLPHHVPPLSHSQRSSWPSHC